MSQVGVVASSPKPTAAPEIPPGATIDAPAQTFTNQDTVNVTVNVPASVTGKEGYTVRLYVTLKDAEPVILVEEDIGETAVQVLSQVKLSPGRNDFQAAVFGPGGESERSAIAAWVLDTSKPKISVISPKNNSKVAKSPVKVKGKSQAGAEIRLQNANNNAVATATAGKDGLWTASIEIDNGSNAITVTATDPAGNANSTTLNLRKGSGKLTAVLTASNYRFRASKLPRAITLRVVVAGPGRPPPVRREGAVHGERAGRRGHRLGRDHHQQHRQRDVPDQHPIGGGEGQRPRHGAGHDGQRRDDHRPPGAHDSRIGVRRGATSP